jgi:hypothetical protein
MHICRICGGTGSGVVVHRTPVVFARALSATGLAAALVLLWLLVDPRAPDLAAQVYRVGLFEHIGFAVWDEHWYAGHALPGYSLLFPSLASLLGLRVLAACSVLASVVLFERLVLGVYGRSARWGAVWFAVAAVGDIWIGRLTFALGVTFAVAAVLALTRGRRRWAALLAALCAAASPVAGVLLGLAALTDALARRSPRALVVLALPAAVVVVPLALLFGEGGFEPFPIKSFAATALVTLMFLWALPAGARLLRTGGVVYLLACMLALLIHTPMGSNIERYAVLLAGPLLLCAFAGSPSPPGVLERASGRRSAFALLARRRFRRWGRPVVLLSLAVFVVWGPVRETKAVAGNESTSVSYYAPVLDFLASVEVPSAQPVRVEVPLTRSHWEAALLAPSVSLARGWEKQLDERYDGVLLNPGLTAAGYSRWLREQAVSYVALPDTPLDPSSAQEGRLIRRGLSFLRVVFTSRHWTIYAVLDPTPLLEGPGRLVSLGHDSFALRAVSPGRFLARVRYTRYWTLTTGSGCIAQAPGGWTSVTVRAPGTVIVAARFSVARALGLAGSCRGGGGAHRAASIAGVPGVRSRVVAPVKVSSYRWLVRTRGAPPSIAQENRAHGTSAWRLPGPPGLLGGAARGPVAGYVAMQAIAPGQIERVYVNAPGSHTVRLRVYRMGWYGGRGGRLVLRSGALAVVRQPPCTHRFSTGLTECDWRATLSFRIPAALPSGVYIVKLLAGHGAQSDCLFIVRSARPARLLVEIPTASYEAYNAWGGDSLYPGGAKLVGATHTDQGVEVSYDRPYDSQTGAGQFFIREVAIVRFLERYGYSLAYTTIESIDGDPGQVLGPSHPRALIDVGHSEYWSQRDEQAFARARDHGESLIFISSDTMAWRVRFAPATGASSQVGERDHVIVAYKENVARDPDRAQPTGLFPRGGANLVGSAYNGCITPRVQQPGPPVYRYYAWAPAPSLEPRWLFAHTGVTPSTRIPAVVGYELDQRAAATPPGTRLIGTGAGVPCSSENGLSPTHGTLAETTLYRARSGALVFATGTLGWEYALSPVPQASPDAPPRPDPRVVAMTRNLLARVLG